MVARYSGLLNMRTRTNFSHRNSRRSTRAHRPFRMCGMSQHYLPSEVNMSDLADIAKVVADMLGDCKKMLASADLVEAMLNLHREGASLSGKPNSRRRVVLQGFASYRMRASSRFGIRFC